MQSVIDRDKDQNCATVEEAINSRKSFHVNYQILLPDLSLKHIYMHGEAILPEKKEQEFVLILSAIKSPESAALAARRILKETQQKQTIHSQEISVSASIGISVYPQNGTDAETFLEHADTAMCHAKKQGGNNYQFFKESLNKATLKRFSLERDMKITLKNGDFTLYYQPQLRLSDKKLLGRGLWFDSGY